MCGQRYQTEWPRNSTSIFILSSGQDPSPSQERAVTRLEIHQVHLQGIPVPMWAFGSTHGVKGFAKNRAAQLITLLLSERTDAVVRPYPELGGTLQVQIAQ